MDYFTWEEVLRLLAAAKAHGEKPWLLGAVTFLHALRSSEAVGLTPDNIVGIELHVKRCKGSNPVRDELVEHANPLLNERQALIDLAKVTRRNQKLFPITERTFQRWVHRWGAAAGLSRTASHPHALKHSILTHAADTAKLHELQGISGHKSLGSLGIYLHARPAQIRAARFVALKIVPPEGL